MPPASNISERFRLPILQGVLPTNSAQIPAEIIAGMTLAALAVPEVMGYTKISGTPVVTGLYTILIPMALFAIFGSSRHLVVGADSATAAILAAGLVGIAATGSDEYVALASILALIVAGAAAVTLAEMMPFGETLYFAFVTGLTIGYGDIVVKTPLGLMVAVFVYAVRESMEESCKRGLN